MLRTKTTVYDDVTGDIERSTDKVARKGRHWPGAWWRMELATATKVLDNPDLRLSEYRVWLTLVENMDERNVVILSQSKMAKRLNTTRQVVSKAMRRLIDAGLVERLDTIVWRLTVDTGWNGAESDRWALGEAQKGLRAFPGGKG